ncbi:MAG: Mbeg1-like protein [Gallintestinimicrobium sp.]
MGNVIDYLVQYGDQAFAERAFCDVDVLILAQLSYFDFGSAVPTIAQHKKSVTLEEIDRTADLSAVFADKWYGENNRKLWNALLAGRRFRTMRCNYYRERIEEEQEAQFGAVTFFPEGCEPVVAFRGTDDSVVGWKEDFRLAFRKPLASQEMSSVYLNQVGCKLPGAFMVCGHSKGGNLAAYAATWAETGVQRRITDIYSLDGPGFLPEVFEGDSYEQIRSRVHRILPYSSLVGMLLQNYEQYEVVKSSGIGILQHDAFTWQIEDGKFVKAVDIEAKQKRMNEALNQWIFTLPEEERQLFVETLFQVIDQTGVTTLTEFSEHWKENLKSCLKSLKNLDPETRKRIRRIIKILLEIYGNTLRGEKENEIGKADLPHRRQQRLFELECAGEAARSAGQSRFKDSAIGSWWR